MERIKHKILFISILVIINISPVLAGDCSVCLGLNLSVTSSEQSDKLYLTVGDSSPIYFNKPDRPPRIVAGGLDKNKRYIVKIYFDGKIVQSWYIDFLKLNTSMVTIWRAKGSWRMEPNQTGKCTWPME